MRLLRSSREFAERVETQFHTHGSPFKRFTWWMSLACSIVIVVWLGWNWAAGEQRIYQAGPISTSHQMFENDCAQCHTNTWAPFQRLCSWNETVRSVKDEQCAACHTGMPHDLPLTEILNPQPAGSSVNATSTAAPACAACHREHQGREGLADVADQFCIDCHRDIRSLDDGHPEFAIHRIRKSNSASPLQTVGADHGALALIEQTDEGWQDKAKIRFNHHKHLSQKIDGPTGSKVDLSQNCAACHESDTTHDFMRPISYERHCSSCHPLVFDPDRVQRVAVDGSRADVFFIDEPNQVLRNESNGVDLDIKHLKPNAFQPLVVPHGDLAIVRGYLTDFYFQQFSNRQPLPTDTATSDQDVPHVLRKAVADQTQAAEQFLQNFTFESKPDGASLRVRQFENMIADNSGGCFYCHTGQKQQNNNKDWSVIPPRIPSRWFPNSHFKHDPHRMLDCNACHKPTPSDPDGVRSSHATGDVLLPSISVCIKCHTSDAATVLKLSGGLRAPARSNCIECHTYHKRDVHSDQNRYLPRSERKDGRHGHSIGKRSISTFLEGKPK